MIGNEKQEGCLGIVKAATASPQPVFMFSCVACKAKLLPYRLLPMPAAPSFLRDGTALEA